MFTSCSGGCGAVYNFFLGMVLLSGYSYPVFREIFKFLKFWRGILPYLSWKLLREYLIALERVDTWRGMSTLGKLLVFWLVIVFGLLSRPHGTPMEFFYVCKISYQQTTSKPLPRIGSLLFDNYSHLFQHTNTCYTCYER